MTGIALAELKRCAKVRGSRKRLAQDLGTYESRLSEYINRRRPIPWLTEQRILAKIRADELRLADKIDAELLAGPPPTIEEIEELIVLAAELDIPHREPRHWCSQCECRVTLRDARRCGSSWCKAGGEE